MNNRKNFNIIELSNQIIIIVFNNCLRFDEFLEPIDSELSTRKFNGTVYIDLLLSNGLNARRFFKSTFNGSHLDVNNMSRPEKIPQKIVNESNRYYSSNYFLLEKGVLTNSAKESILRDTKANTLQMS